MRPIKAIQDWEIPGEPREQMFLALAEGATILAFGTVPDHGHLVPAVSIFRTTDEGVDYVGWTYVQGHSDPDISGLVFFEKVPSDFLLLCPGLIDYVSYVEPHLASLDGELEVKSLIKFLLDPKPVGRKLN